MSSRPRPLAGLLVADFSRVLAGPYASMLLGDLGADVVKVERPDGGEERRGDVHRVAVRGLAQLEAVAEDHEAVRVGDRLEQRLAQIGAAQQVGVLGPAEVKV